VDHQQGLKGRALDEIKKLRKDNDSVMKRRGEGEHYIRDLDHENREMQNRLAALLQENE
jgi:NifU-like protein involved in Fe-S cluster formation